LLGKDTEEGKKLIE
jgi:hypothetical protein